MRKISVRHAVNRYCRNRLLRPLCSCSSSCPMCTGTLSSIRSWSTSRRSRQEYLRLRSRLYPDQCQHTIMNSHLIHKFRGIALTLKFISPPRMTVVPSGCSMAALKQVLRNIIRKMSVVLSSSLTKICSPQLPHSLLGVVSGRFQVGILQIIHHVI